MRYEWTISSRYLMARRRKMISLITIISVVGVALGVGVLIFVLSVLGGFASDLREKILGTKAHVVVSAERGELANADAIVREASALSEVVGASSYIESEVIISSASNVVGVVLRGIVPDQVGRTSNLIDNMEAGSLEWLYDPQAALRARLGNEPPDYDELMNEYEDVRRDVDRLREETEALQRELERSATLTREWREARAAGAPLTASPQAAEPSGTGEGTGLGTGVDPGQPVMRLLPGQGGPAERSTREAAERDPDEVSVMDLLSGQGDASPFEAPGDRAERRAPFIPGIVIGTELAEGLHVGMGDEVTIISPDGQLLPTGPAPLSRPYLVVGLFYTGLYEFDRRIAYTLMDEARDLLRIPDGMVSAVDLKLDDLDAARSVETALGARLESLGFENVLVRSWEKLNKSLFSALKLEKVALFIILTIIILVASFSIVSSLVVMVVERGSEIGILKSMGASNREIMRVFAIAGGLIGAVGTSIGVALGIGLCLAVKNYGYALDTDVYYIEYLPIHLETVEVLLTAVAGFGISLLATVYPAIKAARLNPAVALREE